MERASVWDLLVFVPLRAEPRFTKLAGEATVLRVGQPGTHWRAGRARTAGPRRASVALAAVLRACWGQRSPAVLETQLPKTAFCAPECGPCGFGVSLQRVPLFPHNASKLAQSSAEEERGSVSRLIRRVAGVMELGALWSLKLVKTQSGTLWTKCYWAKRESPLHYFPTVTFPSPQSSP